MTVALDVAVLTVHAQLLAGSSGHAHHGAPVWPALAPGGPPRTGAAPVTA